MHHLDAATLVSFGAGTLNSALSTLVEAHLEMCPACRAEARKAAEIGGALMGESDDVEVSAAAKAAVMEQIGSATVHRLPVSRPAAGEMPRALQRILNASRLDDLTWVKAGPGVHMHKLPMPKGESGFFGLLKVQPKAKLPDHGHGGTELTLVLRGGYHDELGEFRRGDIADLDESVSHTPTAMDEEVCICVVANDAPSRFKSLAARFVQRFIGI